MVLIAGIALSILNRTQHDSSSPDTSVVDPQNPNRTSPISDSNNNAGSNSHDLPGENASGGSNMNNDNTNNSQQVVTGDSSLNKGGNQ